MSQSKRLDKTLWLQAGFRALATKGPTGIRVEPLARGLGTTKGSFYWHFADLAAYKQDMLALWQHKVAGEIIAEIMAETDPAARLRALATAATQPAPEEFGGRAIEPAFRAWAMSDDEVMEALKALDSQRIAFVTQLLADLGIENPALAEAIYAAYIGLDDLSAKQDRDMFPPLSALVELVLATASQQGRLE